jgi:hypothetical protein
MMTKDRALLIAVGEYAGGVPADTSGTIAEIEAVHNWLIEQGTDPQNIVACVSPQLSWATHSADTLGIVRGLDVLLSEPNDTRLVFIYIVGHGYDFIDARGRPQKSVLLQANYHRVAEPGVPIDDLVEEVIWCLGAERVLVAANLCRPAETDRPRELAFDHDRARSMPASWRVNSIGHGGLALRTSGFADGLLAGLAGAGRAKAPTGNGTDYAVAFRDLVSYMKGLPGLDGIDQDTQHADAIVRDLATVERVRCHVLVEGAKPDDHFVLHVESERLTQPPVPFIGGSAEIEVLPDRALPILRDTEGTIIGAYSRFVDTYEPTELYFLAQRPEAAPSGSDLGWLGLDPTDSRLTAMVGPKAAPRLADDALVEAIAQRVLVRPRPRHDWDWAVTAFASGRRGEAAWLSVRGSSQVALLPTNGRILEATVRAFPGPMLADIRIPGRFDGLVGTYVASETIIVIPDEADRVYQLSLPTEVGARREMTTRVLEFGPIEYVHQAFELQDRFAESLPLFGGSADRLAGQLVEGEIVDPFLTVIAAYSLYRHNETEIANRLTRLLQQIGVRTSNRSSSEWPDLIALQHLANGAQYGLRDLWALPMVADGVRGATDASVHASYVRETGTTFALDRRCAWTVMHRVSAREHRGRDKR